MKFDPYQVKATLERYKKVERHIAHNERLIAEGRLLDVDTPERWEKFLKRRDISINEALEAFSRTGTTLKANIGPSRTGRIEPNRLERAIGKNDLVEVSFLERGLRVARTVGRIWVGAGGDRPAAWGTGFLISPRLLMTNHHVLEDKSIAHRSQVEFDYEKDLRGKFLSTTIFNLDPETFFFADKELDYAVVAVQRAGTGGRELARYGWNPLIEEEGKTIISQWVNIVQHPNGEQKQLGLRENEVVEVPEVPNGFLWYKTDTAQGSSGAPVYNERWEVVALHHFGVWEENAAGQIMSVDGEVWQEWMGDHRVKWKANEGVRISRILANLRGQSMSQEHRRLFDEIFTPPPFMEERTGETLDHRGTPDAQSNAQVTVAADGSATWTIPLSVSIRLGGLGAPSVPPQPEPRHAVEQPPRRPDGSGPDRDGAGNDLDRALEAARREFGSRADVLNIRLGYVFKNDWITDERALVITVRQKLTPGVLREARIEPFPEKFMGVPVEVTTPRIKELVELAASPAVAKEAFFDARITPEEITYKKPAVPLTKVTDTMRVLAHVSPDAGWQQLSLFLQETNKRLIIGMYDFGARHIAEAVEAAGRKAGFNKMTLVMQRGQSLGTGTKEHDLTDAKVVEMLRDSLGSKFENAWVKIGAVNGWVARSYHIKVAVRDRRAFWLSSGNWQSSNQPKADPLNETPPRKIWLNKYNREWHAVVEHAGLAKVFEAYLLHDFNNNTGIDGGEALELPSLLVPESLSLPDAPERATAFEYFEPFDETREFTVTPLLTPDNYHKEVLALIRNTRDELLIQNQTFNAPGDRQDKLRELIDAVLERRRLGRRVRIIFRLYRPADARYCLEQLKDYGFEDEDIRLQENCHTKGIIVDRKKVLVGSQNWSNLGVSLNRDASLLFEDEPLAKYFAKIFDHDWKNLAHKTIGSDWLPIEVATADKATPEGMRLLTWKDYMEMM